MNRTLVACTALLALGGAAAIGQSLTRSIQLSQSPLGPINVDTNNGVYFPAKVMTAPTASAPTIAGAGSSTQAIAGSDFAGEVIFGTSPANSMVLNFRSAYTSTPYCTISYSVSTPLGVVVTPGGFTATGNFAVTQKLNYICIGRATG